MPKILESELFILEMLFPVEILVSKVLISIVFITHRRNLANVL